MVNITDNLFKFIKTISFATYDNIWVYFEFSEDQISSHLRAINWPCIKSRWKAPVVIYCKIINNGDSE